MGKIPDQENLIKQNNKNIGFNVPEGYTQEMDRKRKKDIKNYADDHDRFMDQVISGYENMNDPESGNSKMARGWMFYKSIEIMNIVRREAQARGDQDMVDVFEEMVRSVTEMEIDYLGDTETVTPNDILNAVDDFRKIGESSKLKAVFDQHGMAINDFIHFSLKGTEIVKRGSDEEDQEDSANSNEGL